jgi:hypothetical protein
MLTQQCFGARLWRRRPLVRERCDAMRCDGELFMSAIRKTWRWPPECCVSDIPRAKMRAKMRVKIRIL